MKKWQDLFHSNVSSKYKDRVLSAAAHELDVLKGEGARQGRGSSMPWYLRWQFASSMAGVFALFLYFKNQSTQRQPQELDLLVTDDQELLEDLDLFEDLDLIESLNEETGELES